MIVDGKLGGRDIVGFQTGDQGVVMAFLGCAVSKSSNRQLPRLSFACCSMATFVSPADYHFNRRLLSESSLY